MEGVNAVKQPCARDGRNRYEVLCVDQVVEQMFATIRDVNSVVNMNSTLLRTLLALFRWDRERLMALHICGNMQDMLRLVKITDLRALRSMWNPLPSNDATSAATMGVETQEKKQQDKSCVVCLAQSPGSPINLGCKHVYCSGCLSCYLTNEIKKTIHKGQIFCALVVCQVFVDDQTVLQLVNDAEAKLRYKEKIIESYVECNKLMRWCPRDQCRHVVKVADPKFRPVQCVCGMKFCFRCGFNWHEPVECEQISAQERERQEELMLAEWIANHAKKCPSCQVPIERIDGCNQMRCSKCSCEFCWVCLRGRDDHEPTRPWCII